MLESWLMPVYNTEFKVLCRATQHCRATGSFVGKIGGSYRACNIYSSQASSSRTCAAPDSRRLGVIDACFLRLRDFVSGVVMLSSLTGELQVRHRAILNGAIK